MALWSRLLVKLFGESNLPTLMDKEDHELLTGDAEKPGLVLAHMLKMTMS